MLRIHIVIVNNSISQPFFSMMIKYLIVFERITL